MADFIKKVAGKETSGSNQSNQSSGGSTGSGGGQDKYIRKGVDTIEGQLGMDQKNETQAEKDRDQKITSMISDQISGHKQQSATK